MPRTSPLPLTLPVRRAKGAARAQDGHRGGYTLLEVLVALAILAIALPVLLGLRNWDVNLRHHARQLTLATLLAQEKLHESDARGFPPLGDQHGEFTQAPLGLTPLEEHDGRVPGFRWTQSILPTPLQHVREITIRVFWPHGTREESMEVHSYVFFEPPTTP